MRKTNTVRAAFVSLISVAILAPRIQIAPSGYGDLAIRIDGVAAVLAGFVALFIVSKRLLIIPIVILFSLYMHGSDSVIMSLGLFFQVISIVMLPILVKYFNRKDVNFRGLFQRYLENVVVYYALVNVIVAIIARYFAFEFCIDSITVNGCIGPYGFLDRPYVFSVFIGVAFVLVCSGMGFSHIKATMLIFGLLNSDSRSISAIMFFLGVVIYLKFQRKSLAKLFSLLIMVVILVVAANLIEVKVNLRNVSFDEVDPSWLMRLHNIERYMEWVDFSKLIFGNGALAFYQFSDAYGLPGPVDNLYIRMASEIGVLGGIIFISIYLFPLLLSAIHCRRNLIFISYVVAVLFISVFHESLIIPRAGHLLVLLGIYLCCQLETGKPKTTLTNKYV